jgi:hypothetical protein
MPTNQKRKLRRKTTIISLDKTIREFLFTGLEPPKNTPAWELYSDDMFDPNNILEAWQEYKKSLLPLWIKKHPCSRPWAWWKYEAPSRDDPIYGKLTDPRQRIGGIGTPSHEVLCIVPHFKKGIPDIWVTEWMVDFYNGRKKDIHSKPIGTNYKEGDFEGNAIDPNDPPAFESEAVYLERHGLLTEYEKTYLTKHPELLKPEYLIIEKGEVYIK